MSSALLAGIMSGEALASSPVRDRDDPRPTPPIAVRRYRTFEACSTFASGISTRVGQAGAWPGAW
jgi:hypothetical protein